MRQTVRKKARYATKRPQRPVRKVKSLGPQELRALRKTELVSMVLELRAQLAAMARESDDRSLQNASAPRNEAALLDSAAPAPRATSLVINGSVRSGQIIEFPGGDVTVIGSVASGAEIVAGGSIHVYGTLRGRAIAGTSGDQEARIFCRSLQAELLSIDGRYRVAENFDPKLRCRPIQAHLEGMKMALAPLDDGDAPLEAKAVAGGRQRRATDRFRNLIGMGTARLNPAFEVGSR